MIVLSAEQMSNDYQSLPEHDLHAAILKKDNQAFSELVYRYSKKYFHLAYRMLHDDQDAEDVVQECFVKYWNSPHLWDSSKAKFTTWFYRVVTNKCLDLLRKRKRTQTVDDADQDLVDPLDVENEFDHRHKEALLKRALNSLSEPQRMAITLCFYEGLSNQEAADIMEVSLRSLQSHILRGKKALKESLYEQRREEVPYNDKERI